MGENDDPLETIYHALLIIFYVALPLLMTILRCFTMKNIPKVDLVFLFFAITFWFWIVWFSTILTNDLVSWSGANLIPGQYIRTEKICPDMCLFRGFNLDQVGTLLVSAS